MLVSVYIRKEDEELWRLLPKKTQAIHELLHEQKLTGVTVVETIKPKSQKIVESRVKPDLLAIPGVEKASEARCKGTHYMSRVNCGKIGCPW